MYTLFNNNNHPYYSSVTVFFYYVYHAHGIAEKNPQTTKTASKHTGFSIVEMFKNCLKYLSEY